MSIIKDQIEIGVLEAELGTQKALNRMPPLLKWLTIIIVLGTIPLYFTTRAVSKNIWVKKYQTGIITAKQSFIEGQAPYIGRVSLTTVGDGIYSAAVEIGNKNLELSADNIKYNFTFYNSEQKEVYSSPVQTMFLLPDQTKYIILPRFTSKEKVNFANFNLQPEIRWQKRLSLPTVSLVTSIPRSYQQASPYSFIVEGDFTNKSPYVLKKVFLTFLLFDSSNNIIGTSSREEDNIKAGDKRGYKQIWPSINGNNIYEVKVFADTNTLDPSNLGQTAVPNGSASDLSRPE